MRLPQPPERARHPGGAAASHADLVNSPALALQRLAGNRAMAGALAHAHGASATRRLRRMPGFGDEVPGVQAQSDTDAANTVEAGDSCGDTRCGGIPSDCPSSFCCPFPLGTAGLIKSQIQLPFLAAIGAKVTPSVVPVWATWFNGGSGVQDFSARFGADFTSDPTTVDVSSQLTTELPGQLDPTAAAGLATTSAGAEVSLLPALPSSYKTTNSAALESPGGKQMDFSTIGTAPGNLAGGIGKTQTSCAVGAQPSPQDDARALTDVRGTFTRNPDGTTTVTPRFIFNVKDTVDLCPGNCGSGFGTINEQQATVPMSRLEASGVSGDVPFFVNFPSQAQAPFILPAPAPPKPTDITISSSALFEFGQDTLRPDAADALIAQLGDSPSRADLTQPFIVEGHTDSKGSDEFNMGLSQRRAQRVATLLEQRFPNLAGHITPTGFGESRPVAPNTIGNGQDNPEGRRQNRRVELHFSATPA